MRLSALAATAALVLSGCAAPDAPEENRTIPNPSASITTPTPGNTPPPPAPAPGVYTVDRVVDGDTVRIFRDDKSVPLRIIGGDTPETVNPRRPVECYGPEASLEAKRLLDGTRVKIIYDPTQGTARDDGRRVDIYGRDLVYLELADGRDYMEHMISEGFAKEYRYRSNYERMPQYRAAQAEAKEADRGLWGACSQ